MNNKIEIQYFFLIKKKKISFIAFDPVKGPILTNEVFIEDFSIDNVYYLLENFLEKNILKIEKDLKNFIKNIYIIFENDNFFIARTSIRHDFEKNIFTHGLINEALIDIRNHFYKYSPGYEIVHMIIDRYVINGDTHKDLPQNIDSDNIVIQANFICLDHQIIKKFKKIFSKYQISINKILSYDYLKNLDTKKSENIAKVANDNINGYHLNEVFMVRKKSKNQGFFEKFFNFFN